MKLEEITKVNYRDEVLECVKHDKGIVNNCYRLMSEGFINVLEQARKMYSSGDLKTLHQFDREIVEGDLGKFAEYHGQMVPLELPMLDEAEYEGRDIELNEPMRSSGPKKFKVYVKNPKTGNVNVVHFGAEKGGGQRLAVDLDDKKQRDAFAARHKCDQQDDKMSPAYWSCRLPRYAKQLGLSGGGNHWW